MTKSSVLLITEYRPGAEEADESEQGEKIDVQVVEGAAFQVQQADGVDKVFGWDNDGYHFGPFGHGADWGEQAAHQLEYHDKEKSDKQCLLHGR